MAIQNRLAKSAHMGISRLLSVLDTCLKSYHDRFYLIQFERWSSDAGCLSRN